MEKYGYIVVGAGTAGSVLAARLSEDPAVSVLLLEAGSSDRPGDEKGVVDLWGSRFDWAFTSVPQENLDDVTVPIPRGRTLGGSSSINGSYHIRGHRSSYDAWGKSGAQGWDFEALLASFRRSEQTTGMDTRWRGTDGHMVIEPPTPLSRDAFYGAVLTAAEEVGHKRLVDGNGAESEGVAPTEINLVQGKRQSAADAYLRPVQQRPNLTVTTDATVHRLLMEDRRCVGVEYVVDGQSVQAGADREVVLCAGAVGSPHLLQLSGIGPAAHLREAGIEVVHDLPGVGGNLQDHTYAHVGFATSAPVPAASPYPPYILTRSSATVEPDLQLVAVPLLLPVRDAAAKREPWGSDSWTFSGANGYCIAFSYMRPESRGSVRLAGPDPATAPLIDLGLYAESRDLDRMVAGLRAALAIGRADSLASLRQGEEAFGHPLETVSDMQEYVKLATGSYFHLAGTCAMGTGSRAVVDSDLKVHGVQGIRVVDASVMPSLPAANTNATVLAIAERATELIRS
ncbi:MULTISPECIES: GMC family oxidoreductase N-terminal domain-containing protein [unclassified Streptomyces]|uniref:GMC family oxidoreductase n=1 Tax=unclassified Streptomyces TaxID=2593676 RepID=UPI0034488F93